MLNSQKRRFPVRADIEQADGQQQQAGQEPLHSFYVSIGKSKRSVDKLLRELDGSAAGSHTTVVAALAGQPWLMQYLAPFAAVAAACDCRARGQAAVVVIDDALQFTNAGLDSATRFVGRPLHGLHSLHAAVLGHAGAARNGGSVTIISIADTVNDDISERTTDAIIEFCDDTLHFDGALAATGTRPALNILDLGLKSIPPYVPEPARSLAADVLERLHETEAAAKNAKLFEDLGLELDVQLFEEADAAHAIRAALPHIFDQRIVTSSPAAAGTGTTLSASPSSAQGGPGSGLSAESQAKANRLDKLMNRSGVSGRVKQNAFSIGRAGGGGVGSAARTAELPAKLVGPAELVGKLEEAMGK